jgi:RimJ/RimL family protein N-acetyltransferase
MAMENSSIIAETARLTIRRLAEPDIPAVAAIWADEQVTRFMGGPRNFDKLCIAFKDDLKAPPTSFELWVVVEKNSGRIAGHCGLVPKVVDGRDEVELTYVIATIFWGRGYATEAAAAIRDHAFRHLGLTRIVALIDPANAASERVALKLGLKFEANTIRPSGNTTKVYAASG